MRHNTHIRTLSTRAALRRALVVALCVCALAAPAMNAHAAAYTWGGQTFTTYNAMVSYIQAYLATWRELHGLADTSTVAGVVATQQTVHAFSVRTEQADHLLVNGVDLHGRLDLKDSRVANVWFIYGTCPDYLTQASEAETIGRDYGTRDFDREIRALRSNTVYYYRAMAKNEDGTVMAGDVRTFTTPPDPNNTDAAVRVTAGSATDVNDDRATLSGYVSFKKDATYAYVWFEYGYTDTQLDGNTAALFVNNTMRTFSTPLYNLERNESYYWRVVGEDQNGVRNYSAVRHFTTRKEHYTREPRATTNSAALIGAYSATLSGNINMYDERNGTVFFVYGEDRTEVGNVSKNYHRYASINERGDQLQKRLVAVDLDTKGTFTLPISNLDQDTTIYYAIGVEYRVNNSPVILLGSVRSFKTTVGD